MQILSFFNFLISVIFVVCYSYQLFYIPLTLFFRKRKDRKVKEARGEITVHDFAFLICARNEETVIGDLIDSIKDQTYPAEHIHIFLLADNCTDGTASVAAQKGAVVYTRTDAQHVGKGYALSALIEHLNEDFPEGFDGYFVFDADNVLASDYVEKMNESFCDGSEIVTSYRNCKNFSSSWISATSGLWFLRETRYLNNARFILGTSSSISGTGYLFSRSVFEEYGRVWPFHLLTEDLEFSVDWILKGRKVDLCTDAVFYDEQTVKFSQSFRQRLRWSRGYIQVLRKYFKGLLKGIFHFNFSCFDFFMNIAPAYALSLVSIVTNTVFSVIGLIRGEDPMIAVLSIGQLLLNSYLLTFAVGLITVISEWKMIKAKNHKKILAAFAFPVFMFSFIPIAVAALFMKVKWKPIEHRESVEKIKKDGGDTGF